MLLDDLVGVIETLKERIATHGATLRENETRTRMALIDPLLQVLGWDTSEPAVVLPEYDVSGRKADYALLSEGGSPVATVEAKKLGEPLASHRMQMLNYSNASGVEYAGLTDGDRWELYEVFKRGQLEDRRILDVSIADTPVYEAALKLLLLWRPNLASGQPVEANAPVLVVPPDVPPDDTNPPGPTPKPDPSGTWISLSNVVAGKGQQPPKAIRFSTGQVRNIPSWRQILVEVAEKLANDGTLTATRCPIAGLSFINSSPVHLNGTNFYAHKQIAGGLYLNVQMNSIQIVASSRKLLSHFGVNPETVELQFE